MTIDRQEYYVNDVGKIMGILAHMVRGVMRGSASVIGVTGSRVFLTEEAMMRKWLLRMSIVGILAIGALCALSWYFRDPISFENFERIQQGMSEADVETILGRPADEVHGHSAIGKDNIIRWSSNKKWSGNGTSIEVPFGVNGTVDGPPDFVESDTIVLKIRRWLGFPAWRFEGA